MSGRTLTWAIAVAASLMSVVTLMAGQSDSASTGIEKLDARTRAHVAALLPERPAALWVVDADAATPALREKLLTLDGFVVEGQPGIYLVKQSRVLQGALQGSETYERVLASIIWHEMAHLDGSDEREAQRREEALWTGFILHHQVDEIVGLRYLDVLKKRRSSACSPSSADVGRSRSPAAESGADLDACHRLNGMPVR